MTDPTILTRLTVPDDETVVEVPASLLDHLAMDGLNEVVTNVVPPIVSVTDAGHYIIQGKWVPDADVLSQMNIPDHETCILVTKSAVLTLLTMG